MQKPTRHCVGCRSIFGLCVNKSDFYSIVANCKMQLKQKSWTTLAVVQSLATRIKISSAFVSVPLGFELMRHARR